MQNYLDGNFIYKIILLYSQTDMKKVVISSLEKTHN